MNQNAWTRSKFALDLCTSVAETKGVMSSFIYSSRRRSALGFSINAEDK